MGIIFHLLEPGQNPYQEHDYDSINRSLQEFIKSEDNKSKIINR